MSIFIGITAAVTIAWTGDRGCCHNGGANVGVGLHGRAYLVNLIDCQFAGAQANKHSVVLLLLHAFFSFLFFVHRLTEDGYGHCTSSSEPPLGRWVNVMRQGGSPAA